MAAGSVSSGYSKHFDYRVDILRRRNRVTATLGDALLAQSERTLLVDEQSHGLVFYFPRSDVNFDLLIALPERSSACPWKGTAAYWASIRDRTDPIAWSYVTPYPEVALIKEYIAFYQDKVTVSIGTAPYLPIERSGT